MTQEDKDLLLRDLSARLPYGFIVHRYSDNVDIKINTIDDFSHFLEYSNDEEFKPYLRSLSSMTEEEFFEHDTIKFNKVTYRDNWKRINVGKFHDIGIIPIDDYLDWLNAHHFDYRGLIERGLAIEVTEENNPYKE